MENMENPIPKNVRSVLYIIGMVIGGFVAIVVPDVLNALGAEEVWTGVATRASGSLTLLLSALAQSHLADPAVKVTESKTETSDEGVVKTHTVTEVETEV